MVEIDRPSTEFIEETPKREGEMVLTSVRVSSEEWEFCKTKNLKFSELLREKIREEMAVTHGNLITNVRTLNKKMENLAIRLEQACRFIEKKGFIDEYLRDLG